LLRRIGVIILGFLIASAVAGVVITAALLRPDLPNPSGESGLPSGFWVLVLLTGAFSGAVAIVPLFLFALLAEMLRLRSVLLYVILGAAVMPFGYFWTGFAEHIDPGAAHLPMAQEAAIAVAAGAALGFVYWLMVGRKAGAWRSNPI
jgi:hypothetical protein